MLIVRVGETENITTTLTNIVQGWLLAERSNQRFAIEWPNIPERLRLQPFFDSSKLDSRGATFYQSSAQPAETNRHLLQYYYRRLFTQILHIKHPTLLPYAHKHLVVWSEASFPFLEKLVRHHWCKTKIVYRFGTVAGKQAPIEVPFTPGVVAAKQHDQISLVEENWNTFLFLAACEVLVGPPSSFLDTVALCFRNKEQWVVKGGGLSKAT